MIIILRLLPLVVVVMIGCAPSPVATPYQTELQKVRAEIRVGDSIYRAKAILERKGKSVTDVYDPTGLGKYLIVIVYHDGLSPTGGLQYAAGGGGGSSPVSTVIRSDPKGIITEIR